MTTGEVLAVAEMPVVVAAWYVLIAPPPVLAGAVNATDS
jgi:hypothetical protein